MKVVDLNPLLTDQSSRPQAMELIRSMIDSREVDKEEKRSKPEDILIGAMCEIFNFYLPLPQIATTLRS